MKLYVSTLTVSVSAAEGGINLEPGMQFDADQVIGHQGGKPYTVGDGLGTLLGACTPVQAEKDAKPAARRPQPSPAAAEATTDTKE